MAWTTDDLATIDAAIASGVKRVTFADGKTTEYQNTDHMVAARTVMASEVALQQRIATGGSRRRFAVFGSGL